MTKPLDPNIGYNGMHQRLRRLLGKASCFSCVDCGKSAKHWSLTISDSTVVFYESVTVGDTTSVLAFSRNLNDYDSRCASCHFLRDKPNAKLTAEQVREIRAVYYYGKELRKVGKRPRFASTQPELSRRYNVSNQLISVVLSGKCWVDVDSGCDIRGR